MTCTCPDKGCFVARRSRRNLSGRAPRGLPPHRGASRGCSWRPAWACIAPCAAVSRLETARGTQRDRKSCVTPGAWQRSPGRRGGVVPRGVNGSPLRQAGILPARLRRSVLRSCPSADIGAPCCLSRDRGREAEGPTAARLRDEVARDGESPGRHSGRSYALLRAKSHEAPQPGGNYAACRGKT